MPFSGDREIFEIQKRLQFEKIKRWRRRVPLGDLFTDRSQNAQEYGFGRGTTMYDSALVLGNVKVGENCWIGPNVLLDGTGGLEIGDWVCIDANTQVYSHDSSRRFVNMGAGHDPTARTKIGSGVFIGPNSVISMGVTIGDRCMVGAFSLVTRDIPSGSKAYGQPAVVRSQL